MLSRLAGLICSPGLTIATICMYVANTSSHKCCFPCWTTDICSMVEEVIGAEERLSPIFRASVSMHILLAHVVGRSPKASYSLPRQMFLLHCPEMIAIHCRRDTQSSYHQRQIAGVCGWNMFAGIHVCSAP